jgi:hypothetical protein
MKAVRQSTSFAFAYGIALMSAIAPTIASDSAMAALS